MACAGEAKDSRESMDDLDGSFYSELWCGLKVGNPFLYIFFSFSLFYRDSRYV